MEVEQTLVKQCYGTEDCRLSSLNMDCLDCRCKRRPYPTECIQVTSIVDNRTEQRPHVLFWRPWAQSSSRNCLSQRLPYAKAQCEIRQAGQKPVAYQHPVRLFWPTSKPLDVEADDLLQSFPVQATLSLYDSDSDTDMDEENSEEEHDSGFESE